jgi:uncharacterized protein (TIGR02186 family)
MRLLALALCLLALPLKAEEVVLGLSSDKVAITATFEGSEILVFGAVKREVAIPDIPLDVVITVAGPSLPVSVRRKDRRFGIWVNTDEVRLDAAPTFYAVATTGPLDQVLTNTEDLRHRVSIPRAIRSVGAASMAEDVENFTEALIRIRRGQNAYQLLENTVALDEQTLFRTAIRLPAIDVHKVGLERWLFTLSREQPLVYGLLSIAIAIAAGWGASAAFQVLRRG